MANYGIVPGQVSLQDPTQGGGFDWMDFMRKKYQPSQGVNPTGLGLDTNLSPQTSNDVNMLGSAGQGALSMGGTGAAIGTAIMPGLGTAIGAGAGVLAGAIGGAINGSDEESNAKVVAAQAENDRMEKLKQDTLNQQMNESAMANQGMGNFLQMSNQATANGRINNFRSGLHTALTGRK